jgi:hypothetical protein
MDFKGGTYIRQIEAPSPKQACVKWAQSLETSNIEGLGIKGKTLLIDQMKDEELTPINETINTWCASALIRGKVALITLIQTEIGES